YALSVTAWNRVTGPIVLATFRTATAAHGIPASTLTDNGMVYTTRYSGGRGGRNSFEHELRRLGITQKNGKPNLAANPGQGRAVPADPEKAPGRPGPPARHPRRAPGLSAASEDVCVGAGFGH